LRFNLISGDLCSRVPFDFSFGTILRLLADATKFIGFTNIKNQDRHEAGDESGFGSFWKGSN
jgi:hypothetical protein